MRLYKSVPPGEDGNGSATTSLDIYGSNRAIELHWAVPEWNRDKDDPDIEQHFTYKGSRYYLSEIMAVNPLYNPNPPEWMKEFDGYASESYFSGVLVKFGDKNNEYQDECVRAYTYIS